MSSRGFIFDLDGTLVDNMPLHAQAFGLFLQRHRLPPVTPELRARLDGLRNRDIFPILFDRPLPDAENEGYAEEKESTYRELSQGRLAPLAGLLPLLDALDRRGIPFGLATSAPAKNVVHTLRELSLDGRVRHVTRSDEVPRGKPYPDVFLEAARRLEVPPEACIAFEDAPVGLAAARAAGMTCVGLTTHLSREAFAAFPFPPDHVARDYDEYLAGPGRWLLGD